MSDKLIYGLRINENDCVSHIKRKAVKEYELWARMLERCTKEFWVKSPTYTGTTCSDNFKSYTFFYRWCQKQVGFGNKDDNGRYWQLDKDLLGGDIKMYSEDTCVFVPARLNSLLIRRKVNTSKYATGVIKKSKDKTFTALYNDNEGTQVSVGGFLSEQDAFNYYKICKEAVIKSSAKQYKGLIDERVYNKLMNYEVTNNKPTGEDK